MAELSKLSLQEWWNNVFSTCSCQHELCFSALANITGEPAWFEPPPLWFNLQFYKIKHFCQLSFFFAKAHCLCGSLHHLYNFVHDTCFCFVVHGTKQRFWCRSRSALHATGTIHVYKSPCFTQATFKWGYHNAFCNYQRLVPTRSSYSTTTTITCSLGVCGPPAQGHSSFHIAPWLEWR